MSTTKKVAPKVVGVEKKAPVKKRVKKIITSSNLFIPDTSAAGASVGKKSKTVSKPIFSEIEKTQLSTKHGYSLALFSSVSARIVSSTGAATIGQASRIIGAIIACVGISYTFSMITHLSPQFMQQAELIDVVASTSNPIDCTLYQSFILPDCLSQIHSEPTPTLIEPGADIVSGSVQFKILAPHADLVKLQLRDTKTSFISAPLYLQKTDVLDEWQVVIDTKKLPNAYFVPKIIVKNVYSLYESFDTGHQVTIFNPNDSLATATTTPDVVELVATTTPAATLSTSNVVISVGSLQSTTDFKFYIKTPPVNKVVLSAVHIATGKIFTIGEATRENETTWSRLWQTKDAPIGFYRVRTRVILGTQTFDTDVTKVQKTESFGAVVPVPTPVLRPPVTWVIAATSPFQAVVPVRIEVENASSVDFSIMPKASLTSSVLGNAVRYSDSVWTFNFDTARFPDGEYSVITKIRNTYGTYEFVKTGIILRNKVAEVITPEQAVKIAAIKEVVKEISETVPSVTPTAKTTTAMPVVITPPTINLSNLGLTDSTRRDLRAELDRLGVALRLGDETKVLEIKDRIEAYASHAGTATSSSAFDIKTALATIMSLTREETKKVDNLMSKRTNERAAEDSDHDSVSNYDEIAIYKTNPYSPDTDNDGFLDGIEILSGYDPLNAKPEVLVRYESPQDTGVVREDLLAVTSISTAPILTLDATTSVKETPTALISGKGLANSFITLYIFSTPIIVTLKTDADGSWSYRFDKELEDGKHEMYVGVTDNAGKIIAKSNSFSFVKEAEAFTGTETQNPVLAQSDTVGEMTSDYTIYLVLGVSTVAIGLVLMLLGVQLRGRRVIQLENITTK